MGPGKSIKGIAVTEGVTMLCTLEKIEQEKLDAVKALERELGKTLLAFHCSGEAKPADLTQKELERIREVEDKLNLALVAVDY
jgi:hypothetical protein